MPAPTAADLIFSEQANHNFSKKLGDIRRSTLSISNRLHSILEDAAFAQEVAAAFARPLIANERCGSWYIDPQTKGGSAYFKSTDGHTGVWKFSSRRLNFHLLEIIGKHDGCIIVDSTRRGKRMPDALSKTIPIWCSIMNMFLFPTEPQYHLLYTPPQVVSQSEHAQMSALLPSFLESLKNLQVQQEAIREHISKPLRPAWVTPESYLNPTTTVFEDFHPVICCTVSRRVVGGEVSEAGYIQGAGDDTENWAHGLTPRLFWEQQESLLNTAESELPAYIESLMQQTVSSEDAYNHLTAIRPTSTIFITDLSHLETHAQKSSSKTLIIGLWPDAASQASMTTTTASGESSPRLDIVLGQEKIGAKKLRLRLPEIIDFVEQNIHRQNNKNVDKKDVKELRSSLLSELLRSEIDQAATHNTAKNTITSAKDSTYDKALDQGSIQSVERMIQDRLDHHSPNEQGAMPRQLPDTHILIACESGKQVSVGVGLAIACLFFDDAGNFLARDNRRQSMNKSFVASRLAWFSTSMPGANPSRDVLQSVRRYLFEKEI